MPLHTLDEDKQDQEATGQKRVPIWLEAFASRIAWVLMWKNKKNYVPPNKRERDAVDTVVIRWVNGGRGKIISV